MHAVIKSTRLSQRASLVQTGHQILSDGYNWLPGGSSHWAFLLTWHFLRSCGGVRYTRNRTKCGGTNYIGVETFYQSNRKDFFLLRLVTAQCKQVGVTLFDTDEVLPTDPPFTLFLLGNALLLRERGGERTRTKLVRWLWSHTMRETM